MSDTAEQGIELEDAALVNSAMKHLQQPGTGRKRPGLRKYAKLDPAMAKDILQKAESGELATMAYQYGDRIQPKPGHLYLVHAVSFRVFH